jgi:hypothetical protein
LAVGVARELPYGGLMSNDDQPPPDDGIRACVARLSRPRRGGGRVIERAAIMAEGSNCSAILDWLAAAAWTPEDAPADARRGGAGLYGVGREAQRGRTRPEPPRRYFSPPGDVA